MALINFLFESVIYRLIFRRYALANADLSITVDDDGIRWSAKGVAGNLGWALMKRVYLGKDHVFVFISKIEGLGFPRRGLPTGVAFDELVNFLRSRRDPSSAADAGGLSSEHGHETRGTPSPPGTGQLRVGELIRHAMADILQRGEVHDPAWKAWSSPCPRFASRPT